MFGQIATRVWDVLQKPRDGGPDPVADLLKALSAVEFGAGMYRAVHALARATGDDVTAAAEPDRWPVLLRFRDRRVLPAGPEERAA